MNCPEKVYADFGLRVAARRKSLNMTQADLARKIGLVRASVANIETGRQRVLLHTFLDICDTLGFGPAVALGIPSSMALFGSGPAPKAEVDRILGAIHDHTKREIARLNR